MGTFPQQSPAVLAQSLTGSQIQSAYADTGNGTVADLGAWPKCVASGTLAVAGAITTMTVRLAVLYPGNAALVGILSHKSGSTSADAVEWNFTAGEDFALLTTDHIGGKVYLQVKGDVDGTSGDTFTGYLQGVSP